jgi:hypothetical protein
VTPKQPTANKEDAHPAAPITHGSDLSLGQTQKAQLYVCIQGGFIFTFIYILNENQAEKCSENSNQKLFVH